MLITSRRRKAIKTYLIVGGLVSLALILSLPAQAASMQRLDADQYGQIEFNTPFGNIGCIYTPEGGTPIYETMDGHAELQCDRVEPSYVRAFMSATGEAEVYYDVGEASCCSIVQQLDYGQMAQMGPFQCLSERRGLSCERGDGRGFFVSRAAVEAR